MPPAGHKLAFEVLDDDGRPMWRAYEPIPDRTRSDEGQRTDYGTNWPKRRDEIAARDGWACRECGSRDDIQVHHIKRLAEFDGDTVAANADSNLITLCRTHHLARHGKTRRP